MCNDVNAKLVNYEIITSCFESKMAKSLLDNESLKIKCDTLNESLKEKITKSAVHTNPWSNKYDKFKAQLQEVGFTVTSINHEPGVSTVNNGNTKYTKPSILGKPVFQSKRNLSVARQPSAFRSKRAKFSKTRFASQVDVEHVRSKSVFKQKSAF
jgi:hypothetical protein